MPSTNYNHQGFNMSASVIHRYFFSVFIFFLMASKASAFSAGAGTCNVDSLINMGGMSVSQGTPATLSMTLSKQEYTPGETLSVTIDSTATWKGILLYAENLSQEKVGSFSFPPGYKAQSEACQKALTHTNSDAKPASLTIEWTAPTDQETVTFRAAIADGSGGNVHNLSPIILNRKSLPPQVISVAPGIDNEDSIFTDSDVSTAVTKFLVTLDQEVKDPVGDDLEDDVTNPANFILVEQGENETFQTLSCLDGLAADDVSITVNDVEYSSIDSQAIVSVNDGQRLAVGAYRFIACGSTSIENLDNTKLDGNGDGTGGDDYIVDFTISEDGRGCMFFVLPVGLEKVAVLCL